MTAYVPPPAAPWATISPREAGLDENRLAEAASFAQANESPWPRSMYLDDGRYVGTADMGETPPDDAVLGHVEERGGSAGLVLRGGRIAGQWGDTARPDMTFSVAKSYLALLAGIAVDCGLIASIDDPVRLAAPDPSFDADQNRSITWRHLLQQTSEWEGTLFEKADRIDRNRHVGPGTGAKPKGSHRDLQAPGTHWEYNDVRVNRLALSLLQVFRRPLPDVLREAVMEPIGASSTWVWRGYRNAIVDIDGKPMESVSGGAHWGGGMVISAQDHARVGLLVQRGGDWGGRQVISRAWMDELAKPCTLNPVYGLLWWPNTRRGLYPSAPQSSLFALGMGTNLIWIDAALDLTVVVRWIAKDKVDGFVGRVLASLKS